MAFASSSIANFRSAKNTADNYSLADGLASFYALSSLSINWRKLVMAEHESPKRRGRPRLPDEERKRHTMTFRMRDELRTAYAARAEKNGSSISEEVEKSLERETGFTVVIADQKKIIEHLKLIISNCEKQIDNYKDIVAQNQKFFEGVNATNYYLLKKMYELNSDILEDMKAGRDFTSRVGSRKDCEDLLAELRVYFAHTPEPDLSEIQGQFES